MGALTGRVDRRRSFLVPPVELDAGTGVATGVCAAMTGVEGTDGARAFTEVGAAEPRPMGVAAATGDAKAGATDPGAGDCTENKREK